LGYAIDKFVVIANDYDLSEFKPDPRSGADWRQAQGVDWNLRLLGMVGRWNAQKDHRTLLAELAQLKDDQQDFLLILVGSGCDNTNGELRDLVDAWGISDRVLLLGRRGDVPQIMNAIDIAILPSSHGEAFPNVVAEAMACGTPCVVTDVGDAAEIVGDTGWVLSPRSPESLAHALRVALEECSRLETWKERQFASRQRIETRYSMRNMVANYDRLWRAL
jgi:glycosyltransferase involved in cell wall biosynthesis